MRCLLVFLSFAFIVASPAFADPASIAVRIDDIGAVIVPVHINGRGPFEFLVDTGSSHSVVSRSLADELALRFVARTSVLTSTGREWRPVVNLDQTTIGGAESEGLLASVASSTQLDGITRGIDGIIGQDFLFGLNYTLDYRTKRLVWSDEGFATNGARLPLVVQGGRYLVQVTSEHDGQPVLLVPDSGASGFVVYERNGRTAFAQFAADRSGESRSAARMMGVHSLSGRQSARTLMLRELRLGSLTMRDQRVAVVRRDRDDVLDGDGLLPLHLFASVSFNAREQCLVLRR
jgi:predicted aspartyl protease